MTAGRVLLAALTALALALAACGGVDDGKLEGQITDQVEDEGGKVSSVDCPSDEKIEKGNTFSCTLRTAKGTNVPIKVKITSEDDGGRAEYTIPPDILTGAS